jgi:hypothetical protein
MVDESALIRACRCPVCQQSPRGETAEDHRAIQRVLASLDERGRRLLAGLLAAERGHGGVVELAHITGLSRTTIRRGLVELRHGMDETAGRIRRPGGGRKRVEKKHPVW